MGEISRLNHHHHRQYNRLIKKINTFCTFDHHLPKLSLIETGILNLHMITSWNLTETE